jgi:hypothetical protein
VFISTRAETDPLEFAITPNVFVGGVFKPSPIQAQIIPTVTQRRQQRQRIMFVPFSEG